MRYFCPADLPKSFSQLIASIFIFSHYIFQQNLLGEKAFLNYANISLISIFFLMDFAWWKSVGLRHIAYIMIH